MLRLIKRYIKHKRMIKKLRVLSNWKGTKVIPL